MVPITEAEMKSIMQSLKKSGYDEVTSEILKTCASLSHPLSYFYDHLLYTGIFPGHLKICSNKSTLQGMRQN
jgi:hypothetical protein